MSTATCFHLNVGLPVGAGVGMEVGADVGVYVGAELGAAVGTEVGAVGEGVGFGVDTQGKGCGSPQDPTPHSMQRLWVATDPSRHWQPPLLH